MSSGHRVVKPEGSKSSAKRRKISSSGSYESEGSTRGLSSSSDKEKRNKYYRNNSWDEFKNARHPTFNGEINTGKKAESWLLGMKKYF